MSKTIELILTNNLAVTVAVTPQNGDKKSTTEIAPPHSSVSIILPVPNPNLGVKLVPRGGASGTRYCDFNGTLVDNVDGEYWLITLSLPSSDGKDNNVNIGDDQPPK